MEKIAFIIGEQFIYWGPVILGIAAFAGALIVEMLILAAARSWCFSPLRLILAGVALGALFSTACGAMILMNSEMKFSHTVPNFLFKYWFSVRPSLFRENCIAFLSVQQREISRQIKNKGVKTHPCSFFCFYT